MFILHLPVDEGSPVDFNVLAISVGSAAGALVVIVFVIVVAGKLLVYIYTCTVLVKGLKNYCRLANQLKLSQPINKLYVQYPSIKAIGSTPTGLTTFLAIC